MRVEPAAERVLILSYSLVIADLETECDDDADRVRRQRGELRRERGRERREVRALVSCKAAGTEHAADVRVAYVGGGVDGGSGVGAKENKTRGAAPCRQNWTSARRCRQDLGRRLRQARLANCLRYPRRRRCELPGDSSRGQEQSRLWLSYWQII